MIIILISSTISNKIEITIMQWTNDVRLTVCVTRMIEMQTCSDIRTNDPQTILNWSDVFNQI